MIRLFQPTYTHNRRSILPGLVGSGLFLAATFGAIGALAQSASPEASPFLGAWEGSWTSAMSNQRGGIDIDVETAEGDKISGTMAFAGGCGGNYDFSAVVAPWGAVSFGAKMRQPCGRVSVKLHWADGDKKTLIGSFKSDLDGGEIKLARDD